MFEWDFGCSNCDDSSQVLPRQEKLVGLQGMPEGIVF